MRIYPLGSHFVYQTRIAVTDLALFVLDSCKRWKDYVMGYTDTTWRETERDWTCAYAKGIPPKAKEKGYRNHFY